MNTPSSRQRGFTLIEAGAVIAIGAVLAAGALPGMQDLVAARRFDNAATQLAADIHLTRSAAVMRNQALRLSFRPRPGGSCYVIHTGAANACECGSSGPAVCEGGAREIKTVALADADNVSVQANVASLLFDPVHGTSTPTGTLRVLGANQREVRHIVNIMGRARSCSPAPVVPGYRAC